MTGTRTAPPSRLPERAPAGGWERGLALPVLCVVVLGALVYAGTLGHDFLWDDNEAIVGNHFIRRWSNLPGLFSRDYFALSGELSYRPLVTLSYFVDFALWGQRPLGYHLTNVVVHLLAALALLSLARTLTGSPRTALVAALLFVAHPVNTEAVNVPAFREDLLAGLFMAAGFASYLEYDRRRGRARGWCYAGALAAYGCGLLAKEMAATLPLLLVARDLLFRRPGEQRRAAAVYAPFAAVFAGYLLLRFWILHNPAEAALEPLGGSVVSSLLTTTRIVAEYIRVMVLPLGLSAGWRTVPTRWPPNFEVLAAAALILLTLGLAWRLRREQRTAAFAIFAFFILLAPVANVIPIVNPAAERYLYVPAMVYALLLGDWIASRKRVLWFAAALLTAYAALATARNTDWRDSLTLWSRTVEQRPDDPAVHHELGDWYARQLETDKALAEYGKALALDPRHDGVHVNLGILYESIGRLDLAMEHYQIAAGIAPDSWKIRNNIGNVQVRQGNLEPAIASYREALRLDSHHPEPYENLATAYLEQGRFEDALEAIRSGLAVAPDDSMLLLRRAAVYLRQGREGAAAEIFNELGVRGEQQAGVIRLLAENHARAGRFSEAAALAARLLELTPGDVSLYFTLAALHEQAGSIPEAVRAYRQFLAQWRGDPLLARRAEESLARIGGER